MRNYKEIINKKKFNIDKFKLSSFFHNNTALSEVNISSHVEQLEAYYEKVKNGNIEELKYPFNRKIKLVKYRNRFKNLFRILNKRRTRREFNENKISLKELSTLLQNSYGKFQIKNDFFSTTPSAGGLFPLHIYLVSINTNLIKGVYHYYFKNSYLDIIKEDNEVKEQIEKNVILRNLKGRPSLYFVITADLRNVCAKYGERGYRFALIEAGHLAQNLLLVAEAMNIKAVPLGGFYDNNLAKYLEIDYLYNKPLYVVGVGK